MVACAPVPWMPGLCVCPYPGCLASVRSCACVPVTWLLCMCPRCLGSACASPLVRKPLWIFFPPRPKGLAISLPPCPLPLLVGICKSLALGKFLVLFLAALISPDYLGRGSRRRILPRPTSSGACELPGVFGAGGSGISGQR